MKKVFSLSRFIGNLGLLGESEALWKLATVHGTMTLGIPEESARIINGIVGDKWDYVVGKWMIETGLLGGDDIRETHPSYSTGVKYNTVWKWKALDGCRILLSTALEDRLNLIARRSNNSVTALSAWLKGDDRSIDDSYKKKELTEYDRLYYGRSFAPDPDEFIMDWQRNLREEIVVGIKRFVESEFVREVLSGKWLPPGALKDIPYEEAIRSWMENRAKDYPIVLELDDGWKWVDAGGGKSDWICRKLKNCGNVSWGNLRATEESGKFAKMLILLDGRGEPHGLATWNPEYVDYQDREGRKHKFLGGIQGVGSQPLKDEYYGYVLALVNYLNPDEIDIHPESVRYESGKVVDNQNLIELINSNKRSVDGKVL